MKKKENLNHEILIQQGVLERKTLPVCAHLRNSCRAAERQLRCFCFICL